MDYIGNDTNISNTSQIVLSESLVNAFKYLDAFSRYSNLCANVSYFLALLLVKRLRKFSYYHIHHINFIGLVSAILVTAWSFDIYPTFENPILNQVLCYISEVFWGTLKFIRAYAILVLALYRYIGVFKPKSFRFIISSYKYALLTTAFSWFVSLMIFFIAKYSIGTSYGYKCFDGFSLNKNTLYLFFGVTHSIGILLPSGLVIIIYILIQRELNSRKKILSQYKTNDLEHESNSGLTRSNFKRDYSLAFQIILINTLEIVFFLNVFFLTVPLGVLFQGLTPLLQQIILGPFTGVICTFIPVLTLYFLLKIK